MTFPETTLGLKAEIDLAGTWTDISDYLNHDAQDSTGHPAAVVITRGRQDELATSATPDSATFKVWNGDGRFCWRNPTGAYYPNLMRNTSVRFSVPAADNYLRMEVDDSSYASCPDSTDLQITSGTLSVRVDCLITDWTGNHVIAAKMGSTASAWGLWTNDDGTVTYGHYDSSGNDYNAITTVPVPYYGLRIALRVDHDISAQTVTFYTASTMSGTWTQWGDVIDTDATSLADGADQAVTVGAGTTNLDGMYGQIYEVQILSGTTVEADADFTSQTAGAASFTDDYSNTWTLAGTSEISDRDYRFHGQLSSLPVTWDPTGQDVWATIDASGVLRRLQQGVQPNVMSTMTRALKYNAAGVTTIGGWPCEDAENATQIASCVPGGLPGEFWGPATLASDSSFACSLPIPVINGATFLFRLPGNRLTDTANIVRFLLNMPSGGDTTCTLLTLTTGGDPDTIQVNYNATGELQLETFKNATSVYTSDFVVWNNSDGVQSLNGVPLWFSLELQTSTTADTVDWGFVTLAPGAPSALVYSGTYTGTLGNARQIVINPSGSAGLTSTSFGQVSYQSTWTSLFDLADQVAAYIGEAAGVRFARLCSENSINARVVGGAANTVALGYQTPDTLMDLLQYCETTDGGQIYEPRDCVGGLAYRTLDSLTSQPVALSLDYNDDVIVPPLAPTDDDLYLINDVTVTNDNGDSTFSGSMAEATLDDGSAMSIGVVGDYANSVDVTVQYDSQLPDEAGWMLNTGTGTDERYPNVIVSLASTQTAVEDIVTSVRALDIGAHAEITNTPSFLPPGPVELLVWGYSESLGDYCDEENFNTIPERTYEVAISDSDTNATAAPVNSFLASGVTSTATTIDVASAPGDSWTTSSDDYPFDILVGGEQMTATAGGDTLSQTVRVGAFLGEGAMSVSNFDDANSDWKTWTGYQIGVSRVYLGGSGDWSVNSDITQMTALGVRICISIQPSYDPVSADDLTALKTFLTDLQAAGANCEFTMYHEPYYAGLSITEYNAVVRYYGPAIREAGYRLWFVTAESSVYYDSENDWFPGADWVDGVATDIYYSTRTDPLTLCAEKALAQTPVLPFSVWEMNVEQHSYATENSNAASWFSYIQDWMVAWQNAGNPPGDFLLFNAGPGTGDYNYLGDDTDEAAGFEGGIGHWTNWETPGGSASLSNATGTASWSLRDAGPVTVNSGTTVTPTITSTTAGDLLVCTVSLTADASLGAPTMPSDSWILAGSASSTNTAIYVYYYPDFPSGHTSEAITLQSGQGAWATLTSFDPGADAGTVLAYTTGTGTSSLATVTATAGTAVPSGSLAFVGVAAYESTSGSYTWTGPTGWTAAGLVSGTHSSWQGNYYNLDASGTPAPVTGLASASNMSAVVLVFGPSPAQSGSGSLELTSTTALVLDSPYGGVEASSSGDVTSQTITITDAIAEGDLIFVGARLGLTSVTITAVSDTSGATWTIYNETSPKYRGCSVAWAQASSALASGTTITVDISTSQTVGLIAFAVTGNGHTLSADIKSGSGSSTAESSFSVDFTTTTEYEVAVGFAVMAQTPTSSWTTALIETGIAAWVSPTLDTGSQAFTVDQSTAGEIDAIVIGFHNNAMIGAVHCDVTSATDVTTYGLPCSSGDTVVCTLSALAAATARSTQACVVWCNSSGDVLSASYGSTADDSTTEWTSFTYSGTAPTDTGYAVAAVQIGSPTAGEIHYVDNVELLLVAPSNDITTAINFGLDARLGLWETLQAAVDDPVQEITVTRSVNGVVKAQTAGTAVTLYTPPIAALTG